MGQEAIALIGVVVGAAITAGVQWLIARRNWWHQLRIAALDKRLAVHQEAFTLWQKLKIAALDEEGKTLGSIILESQDWWNKNCLYLEPSVREAYRVCINSASLHLRLLQSCSDVTTIKSNWKKIENIGNLIEKAVGLPKISSLGKNNGMKVKDT